MTSSSTVSHTCVNESPDIIVRGRVSFEGYNDYTRRVVVSQMELDEATATMNIWCSSVAIVHEAVFGVGD